MNFRTNTLFEIFHVAFGGISANYFSCLERGRTIQSDEKFKLRDAIAVNRLD